MATYQPPKKNTAWIGYVSLVSQASTLVMQSNPTLASGDFKVSIDGGALANLATLPTVTPASSKMVKISLSSGEMNGDNITVICSDAAGAEWCDLVFNLQTSARQIDDLAYPATSGRSMVVDANGLVDANTVKMGPTGAGVAVAVGASLTFPTSVASPTNITAATGIVLSGVTHTGAVIPTVSAVTGLTASNLDAAISSRMATYTQPTGFLAATFPLTVASTTNITAGTITTVTNLTNAPTAGDLTATMKTSVTTAATAATPTAAAVTGAVGSVGTGGIVAGTFAANALDAVWSTAVRSLTSTTGFRLSSTGVDDILRTALTEGYASDGAAPTLEQFQFMKWAALQEFAISGTTITAKKLDGTTTAMTWTLDSSTVPTSRTRAT